MVTSDPLEIEIAALLRDCEIKFTHESENKGQGLDFYLPEYDMYIEAKQFSTPRTADQIEGKTVIVVQGIGSLKLLKAIAEARPPLF